MTMWNAIKSLMTWPVEHGDSRIIQWYMSGYSIPQVAAGLGAAGDTMIPQQRAVEGTIRQHIEDLEAMIRALEAEIQQLESELASCCR